MKKNPYGDSPGYTTKDGSTIRELMHPAVHGALGSRAQSLAEAVVAPGMHTVLHRHRRSEELYHITAGEGLMTLGGDRFQADPFGEGFAADGDEHDVDLDALVAVGDHHTTVGALRRTDLGGGVDLHTVPFQILGELFGGVGVGSGNDLIEEFEQIHLLATLAFLHLRLGDTESAARLVDEAAQVAEAYGLPAWDDASVERARGEVARREGRLQDAIDIAHAALQLDLSARGRSRMYNLWGTTAAAMGDMETAKMALARELELSVEVGYEGYIASAYGNLAEVSLRLGELSAAAHNQRQCLDLAVAQGSLPMVAFSLIVAARIAGARCAWEDAVRLHTKAEALLEEVGLVLYEDDRRESDRLLADARRALGDVVFESTVAQGLALATPGAVDEAHAVFAVTEIAADKPA